MMTGGSTADAQLWVLETKRTPSGYTFGLLTESDWQSHQLRAFAVALLGSHSTSLGLDIAFKTVRANQPSGISLSSISMHAIEVCGSRKLPVGCTSLSDFGHISCLRWSQIHSF